MSDGLEQRLGGDVYADEVREWVGQRLNLMEGPVRFLLPDGGVSMLDRPGAPFHDLSSASNVIDIDDKMAADHDVQSYNLSVFCCQYIARLQRAKDGVLGNPASFRFRNGAQHAMRGQ